MQDTRDFKGIFIPREIWLNPRLTLIDKGVLAEIDSLDRGDEDGCYASNKHFAEMFGCSERQVSASVKKLLTLGYVSFIRTDGRRRYLRSCIKMCVGRVEERSMAVQNDFLHCIEQTSTQNSKNCESALPPVLHSNTMSISLSKGYEDEEEELTPSRSTNDGSTYSTDNGTNIKDSDARAREDDYNPFGDNEYRADPNTVESYVCRNVQYMSPTAMQELADFKNELPEDVIRFAVDSALDNGSRVWAYVRAILQNLVDSGVRSLDDAKCIQARWRRSRASPQGPDWTRSPDKPIKPINHWDVYV